MDQDLSFFDTDDDFSDESLPLLPIYAQLSPRQAIPALRVGHRILINDWKDEFTVCGVSQNFVLAYQPTSREYTIIQKSPTSFLRNGIREGSFICAADWWIFGWYDGYEFENPSWVERYLASLESEETQLSMRKREQINRISIAADSFVEPLEVKI